MKETEKGYRDDGVFCFLKRFDLCPEENCECKKPPINKETEFLSNMYAYYAYVHERINEEVNDARR